MSSFKSTDSLQVLSLEEVRCDVRVQRVFSFLSTLRGIDIQLRLLGVPSVNRPGSLEHWLRDAP